jgi:hypothetical protein
VVTFAQGGVYGKSQEDSRKEEGREEGCQEKEEAGEQESGSAEIRRPQEDGKNRSAQEDGKKKAGCKAGQEKSSQEKTCCQEGNAQAGGQTRRTDSAGISSDSGGTPSGRDPRRLAVPDGQQAVAPDCPRFSPAPRGDREGNRWRWI